MSSCNAKDALIEDKTKNCRSFKSAVDNLQKGKFETMLADKSFLCGYTLRSWALTMRLKEAILKNFTKIHCYL